MLQNKLYVGIVNLPGYGVVDKRGDFDPLIPDEVFYRVQAILTGRVPETRSLDDAFIYRSRSTWARTNANAIGFAKN